MTNEESNSLCYDKDLFCQRVVEAMHLANKDWDELAKQFCETGYTISKTNLKTYIYQRNASLKLVMFLSRILHVSIDYLLGNEVNNPMTLSEGFDYEFDGSRYAQYGGEYYVYFFPTRTNEPEDLIVATLNIHSDNRFFSELKIPVDDGEAKIYQGQLILSKKTYTAFLNMKGANGEIIQFTFNDPNTFQNKIRFCVAALLSVSSGDAKRMPTLSRAIISDKRLTDEGVEFITANLRLNSKYINISQDLLLKNLTDFFKQENLNDFDKVYERLSSAFIPRNYVSIEERYFLNTFKSENGLSNLQTEILIAKLRNASLSSINCKTPRSIDSRLYLTLKKEDMFIDK